MAMRAFEYATLEEYFAIEESSDKKYEFFQNRIYLMAGGTPTHAQIGAQTIATFFNVLADHPCRVYTSDLRVQVKANGLYTHPDVTVICGDPQFSETRNDTVINPTVIVEVTSLSTRDYDTGAKFRLYRMLPTLQDYILVDSEETSVIVHHRVNTFSWTMTEYVDLSATFPIESLGVSLSVAQLYRNITFGRNDR